MNVQYLEILGNLFWETNFICVKMTFRSHPGFCVSSFIIIKWVFLWKWKWLLSSLTSPKGGLKCLYEWVSMPIQMGIHVRDWRNISSIKINFSNETLFGNLVFSSILEIGIANGLESYFRQTNLCQKSQNFRSQSGMFL